MSQGGIVKTLEKLHPNEWMSTKELAETLNINISTVTANLIKLRIYNEVESRRLLKTGYKTSTEHRLTWKGREE